MYPRDSPNFVSHCTYSFAQPPYLNSSTKHIVRMAEAQVGVVIYSIPQSKLEHNKVKSARWSETPQMNAKHVLQAPCLCLLSGEDRRWPFGS